ncbi:MAG: Rv2993c-like domain-containing protein, partial [Ilumatobacteraceae bacterium]
MRIARFTHAGTTRLGLVEGDTIIDVGSADPSLPTELGAVLAAGTLSKVGATAATAPRLALADVRLEAPIPLPTNFIAIGLNYADHVKESGMDKPKMPVV